MILSSETWYDTVDLNYIKYIFLDSTVFQIDGLVKGHAKPTTFKLGRTNLIPDHSTVFNYTLDVDKPGSWVKWVDQVK